MKLILKTKPNLITRLILFFLVFFLNSCVGTIEDTTKIDKSTIKRPLELSFDGAKHCKAISHNKIDVVFSEASLLKGSANIDDFIYQIFVNGDYDEPKASMLKKDLYKDFDGNFHIVVENLNRNSDYTFSVRVYEPVNNARDGNFVTVRCRTMSDYHPAFNGILEVENYPGIEGHNKLKIIWNTALPTNLQYGGISVVSGYKIHAYNIYMGTSSGRPEDMELIETVLEDRQNPITTYVKSGLLPGESYHFLVRALDEGGREELNDFVIAKATSISKPIEFDGVLSVATPPDTSGLSSLNVKWNMASGDFNNYRIIAIAEDDPNYGIKSIDPNRVEYSPACNPSSPPCYHKAEISDITKTSAIISLDKEHTTYAIFVVACNLSGGSCAQYKGENLKGFGKTSPPLAPFGGITGMTPLDGVQGLSSAKLKWSKPATTQGVCSRIRIERGGEVLKKCADLESGDNSICLGGDANETGGTTCDKDSVTISNLTPNTPYCFRASVEYGTFDNPIKQPTNEIVEKCDSIAFIRPVFANAPVCTSTEGGTKLQVDWTIPSGGMFEKFFVFYREYPDEETTSASEWESMAVSYHSAGVASGSIPANGFKWMSKDALVNTASIQSLKSDTRYRILVKTFIEDPKTSEKYYDNGKVVINCKTSKRKLIWDGWNDIMATGPRINGMFDGAENPADLAVNDYATISSSSLSNRSLPTNGVEFESMSSDNSYILVKRTPDGSNESDEGIIRLEWKMPSTTTGIKANELTCSDITEAANDGFYVYRKLSGFPTSDDQIKAQLNLVQIGGGSGWTELGKSTDNKTFIDYIDGIHPIKDSTSGISFRERANRGRLAMYTVRYRNCGKLLEFTESQFKDVFAEVVIPPANMAFIHRWIANKIFCDRMDKEIDRNNNYRCIYGGLGSILDAEDNNRYYDTDGHILIDRFHLGCNISRHYETNKCIQAGSTTVPFSTTSVAGSTAGDCISAGLYSSTYTGSISTMYAHKGASVAYSTWNNTCHLRIAEITEDTIYASSNLKNWQPINYIDSTFNGISARVKGYTVDTTNNLTEASTGKTLEPPTSSLIVTPVSDEILGRNYTNFGDINGYGNVISSNDSMLPPLVNVHQPQAQSLCLSHSIQIQTGSSEVSSPIRKRLLNAREKNLSLEPSKFLTTEQINTLEKGLASDVVGNCTTGLISTYYSTMRHTYSTSSIENGFFGADTRRNRNQRGTGHYPMFNDADPTSGYKCVSRFGIQDYIGYREFLSDQAVCEGITDGSGQANEKCYTAPSDSLLSGIFSAKYNGTNWPFGRFGSSPSFKEIADNGVIYKNGFEKEFYWLKYDSEDDNHFGRFTHSSEKYDPEPGDPGTNDMGNQYDYNDGIPLYPNITNVEASASSIWYPLKNSQFSHVIGQSLLCRMGQPDCHPTDDNVNYSYPDILGFGEFFSRTIYSGTREALVVGDVSAKYLFHDGTTPAWGNISEQYSFIFRPSIDVDAFAVNETNISKRARFEWEDIENKNNQTRIRCGVKIKIAPGGFIEAVDGIPTN